MNLKQKFLRFCNPVGEARRRDFRECLAMVQAQAEDVDRTIRINGFEFRKFTAEVVEKK